MALINGTAMAVAITMFRILREAQGWHGDQPPKREQAQRRRARKMGAQRTIPQSG
jgi:hypothetical protein